MAGQWGGGGRATEVSSYEVKMFKRENALRPPILTTRISENVLGCYLPWHMWKSKEPIQWNLLWLHSICIFINQSFSWRNDEGLRNCKPLILLRGITRPQQEFCFKVWGKLLKVCFAKCRACLTDSKISSCWTSEHLRTTPKEEGERMFRIFESGRNIFNQIHCCFLF